VSRKLNIQKLLEMPDFEKVKRLGKTLSDDEELDKALSQPENIVIDKDVGIVKFDYKIGGQSIANVGIVGPEHMDYRRLIGALHVILAGVSENRRLESKDYRNYYLNKGRKKDEFDE